jgi:predicted N-formylglutamate amidohydrolase
MTPAFTVVSNLADTAAPVESVAQKVRRLQIEAASLAREQVLTLEHALAEVTRLSMEIADGGEAYPVGARELARRLAEDADASAKTLEMILSRH